MRQDAHEAHQRIPVVTRHDGHAVKGGHEVGGREVGRAGGQVNGHDVGLITRTVTRVVKKEISRGTVTWVVLGGRWCVCVLRSTGIFAIPGSTKMVRGLMARGDIKDSDVIFAVPQHLLMNLRELRSSVRISMMCSRFVHRRSIVLRGFEDRFESR